MPKRSALLINRIDAPGKLLLSLIAGLAAFCFTPLPYSITRLIIGWNIFSLCLLILTWITFFTTTTPGIRSQAKKQDDSRIVIFIITLIATFVSMLSVVQMLILSPGKGYHKIFDLVTAIVCMFLSWCLVHTIFAVRYAHLYYANDKNDENVHAGGLSFPGNAPPDFVDFAYYSFTLGMTFQVSDVSINARSIRRLSLLHGLFSFGFNAAIIALSVNIISGLIGK